MKRWGRNGPDKINDDKIHRFFPGTPCLFSLNELWRASPYCHGTGWCSAWVLPTRYPRRLISGRVGSCWLGPQEPESCNSSSTAVTVIQKRGITQDFEDGHTGGLVPLTAVPEEGRGKALLHQLLPPNLCRSFGVGLFCSSLRDHTHLKFICKWNRAACCTCLLLHSCWVSYLQSS